MRKWLRFFGYASATIVVVVAGLLFVAYRASQHQPAFYQHALQMTPERQAKAGDELEKQVLDLRNDARHDGQWQAVFTDEQINGWLAVDLPEKFPDTLPAEIVDPRVAIDPEQAQVAYRYQGGQISTVVSVAVKVHLTDETNVLAVRIRKVRAGALPLPVTRWLDQIAEAAAAGGIRLRWVQEGGDPVALVTVPLQYEEIKNHLLRLETVELREGEIFLAGTTQRIADQGDERSRVGSVAPRSATNLTVQR